ncbi:MAG: hypothetical protein KBG28_15160 [Kofleriaceae bacterium]|jgi:hypothetical protein|nr:hypothetical protein [Kofleriaceae bacterium]
MFSRRDIQKSVEQLATVLSKKQLVLLVQKLNSSSFEQVSAEWEVVVLAAISRIALLKHEHDSGGSSRPDVRATVCDLGLEFVADVCAVSDATMEDENPVDFFRDEMFAVARELGIAGAGLFLHVEPLEKTEPKQRRLLALPPKGEIQRFIRVHVRPFLQQLAAEPALDRVLEHSEDTVALKVRYDASERRISGGGWPNYTWPRTSRHNPMYRILQQKSDQLRASGFDGLKGVIVCDAGCETLGSRSESITNGFFAQHRKTVSFVATLKIPDANTSVGGRPRLETKWDLFWNPHHEVTDRPLVEETFARVVALLPPALRASQYARNRSFAPDLRYHQSFEGAYMIDGSGSRERIRVSARAVLQTLAGNLRFRESWGYSIPVQVFQAQINEGRMIKSVQLERSEHDDDDWLVIEFDDPDPAVSPYRVPDECAQV